MLETIAWISIAAAVVCTAWIVVDETLHPQGKPMRDVSAGEALVAAIKADTLSILAFQVGMYGFMALR